MRRRVGVFWAGVLLAAWLSGHAAADAVTDAADAAAKAVEAADAEALATLASKAVPDPWIVADELVARGRADVAAKFAAAKPRKDVEKLAAWIEARAGRPDDGKRRKALAEINAKLTAKDPAGAVAAAEAAGDLADDVLSVRIEFGRAIALRQTGRGDECLAAYEASAARAERIGWYARSVDAWTQAGDIATLLGDVESGLRTQNRRLEVERTRGNASGIARALNAIGTEQDRGGEVAKALETYAEAGRIARECGDLRAVAGAEANTAIILGNRGEFAKAIEVFERARQTMRDLGDKRSELVCEVNLCDLARRSGNPTRALAHAEQCRVLLASVPEAGLGPAVAERYGQALAGVGRVEEGAAVLEEAAGAYRAAGDQAGAASAENLLANMLYDAGKYARARTLQESALAVYERTGLKVQAARLLANIGNNCLALGDFEGALERHTRALAGLREAGLRLDEWACVNSIAATLLRLGRPAEAVERFREALAIAEELGDPVGIVKCTANLASALEEVGRDDEALALFRRGEKLLAEAGDDAGSAALYGNLGLLLAKRGERDEALACHERAAKLARASGVPLSLVESLWNLGRGQVQAGRHREAIASAREAVGALSTLVGELGDEEGARARSQFVTIFETGAFAAVLAGDADETAFFLESGRAGALLEALGGREAIASFSIPPGLRAEETSARDALRTALGAQRTAMESRKLPEITAARTQVATARKRLESVVERIQREAKVAANLAYPVAASLGDIRARLREGEAFVVYGVFAVSSVAVVATRESARVVELGPTAAIAAACEAIDASDPGAPGTGGVEALRALVIEPLRLGPEIKRTLVAPDGPLCVVPFSLLVEGREVAEVPSGSTWLALASEGASRGEQVVALGDPVYEGGPGGTRSLQGRKLARLPATADEAKAVGDVVLLGPDATVPGLVAALAKRPRWRAVHLACHGLVDAERPGLSALALSATPDSDGLLKALDVCRMRLPADLVALSACETGRGKVVQGEGVLGFTRAFLHAGTPRVLVSLWKVDDAATRALMERFHAAWKSGTPAARALREAQEAVRKEERWRHPAYWAAWVLWGLPE